MPATPRRSPLCPKSAVGLLLLSVHGCTTFQPVAGDPVLGQRIRTQLTAEGQLRHARVTGVARTSLDGDVLSLESEALLLQVPIPGIDPGLHRSAKVADTLRVLRTDVTSIDVQRFSPTRTGLLAGGVAVAGVLAVVLAGTVGGSDGGDDGPGHRSAYRSFLAAIKVPLGR